MKCIFHFIDLLLCLLPSDVNSPLQTVLLCSPCKDLLCDAEERFWNSIYHIKNALACGRVLPGAGAIEIACIRRLNELAGWFSKVLLKSLSSRETGV